MKWMNSRVTINGKYVFSHVISFKYKNSREQLTQSGHLELPNVSGILKLADPIKVGDSILIEAGYDNEYHREFSGFITKVYPGTPFKLDFEDKMWLAKQTTVNKSYRSIKLKDLLIELFPDALINTQDITLTDFRIVRSSKAKVLQSIKDMYGLDAYYKDDQLYVGLAYNDGEDSTIIYDLQRNCISNNLEYRTKDEVKIKLKVISFSPDNKKIEVIYPEDKLEDYEERTFHTYNKTEPEMLAIAKEKIKDYIYDGFRGTITGFGIPRPKVGSIMDIRSPRYTEVNAKAFADAVEVSYSSKGFRRECTLGRRA